ncbi:MAG: CHAT domain-containing protein, partial [Acidobacteria bacterium]|nr:CHAT domain-containing protein [Acidobacteriota bacterium]
MPEARRLDTGKPLTAALEAGATAAYRLDLGRGESLLIEVEQLGIDLTLEVWTDAGAAVTAVDAPLDRSGSELLLLDGPAEGLRLEIHGREAGAPAGRYRVSLERLAAGAPEIAAARVSTRAGEAYFAGSAGMERQALSDQVLAARLWDRLGSRRRSAQALYSAAVLARLLGDARSALDLAEQALPRWRAVGDTTFEAATANELGLDRWLLGEPAAARELFTRAAELHRRARHPYGEAAARANLCLLDLTEGQLRAGVACYREVLPQLVAVRSRELESAARASAGHAYRLLGEPSAARRELERGVELARAGGDPATEARALNNLADLLLASGEPEEALLRFGEALEIFRRIEDVRWQARTLNNLGQVYDTLGEPERAREAFEDALVLRRRAGDATGEAYTLSDLGRLEARSGNSQRALELHRRAFELWRNADDRRGQGLALSREAEVLDDLGHRGEARPRFEKALALFRDTGDRANEALVLARLGALLAEVNRLGEAAEDLERALELFESGGDAVGQARALHDLADVERRQGRPQAAMTRAERAVDRVETLRSRVLNPDLRAAFSSVLQDAYELRIELLMEAHRRQPDQGFDRRAFDLAERARARTLAELLAENRVELARDVPAPLLAERRELLQRLGAKTDRLAAEAPGSRRRTELEDEREEVLRGLDRAEARIRQLSPDFATLAHPRSLTSTEVQALLDPDTVLLSFVLGRERSFGWRVSRAEVSSFELPPRADLERAALEVRRDLADFDPAERAAEAVRATELARTLLGPVADRLDAPRLVVVADGALAYLPFAALPLPGLVAGLASGDELLVDRHELLSAPSASVLAQLRAKGRRRAPAAGRFAVVADPVFSAEDPRVTPDPDFPAARSPSGRGASPGWSSTLERLPATRREAQELLALAAPAPTFAALDFDASRDTVLAGRLDGYRFVHFATHGILDTEHPSASGLMLSRVGPHGEARNGFLGLRDVYDLELSADLVVLSGCETALGRRLRGEGLVGLVRGFFHAGGSRVLASLWQVDDRATEELMRRFYRHLWQDGEPPATALRAA